MRVCTAADRKWWKQTNAAPRFGPMDVRRSTVSAVLAYLVFFIPLVLNPNDKFGRYHANQALMILLLSTVGATAVTLVPYAGGILAVLLELYCAVLAIRGIVLAVRGRAIGIPLLGNLVLIEYEPKL